jgi:hypothetical protein
MSFNNNNIIIDKKKKNIKKRKISKNENIGKEEDHYYSKSTNDNKEISSKELSRLNSLIQSEWMNRKNSNEGSSRTLITNEDSKKLNEGPLWDEWLWFCNPSEDCSVELLLNRCHMIGLLLARYKAVSYVDLDLKSIQEIIFSDNNDNNNNINLLCLIPGPISEYTLRELRDALQNIQIHWISAKALEIPSIGDVIDALFHRFGVLASSEWPSHILDDQGSIEENGPENVGWLNIIPSPEVDSTNKNQKSLHIHRICIRRFLNVFLVLYRHLYMKCTCKQVEGDDIKDISINIHHAVAGGDDFDGLSMNWDLMPSAKLNYMHDFPGKSSLHSHFFSMYLIR